MDDEEDNDDSEQEEEDDTDIPPVVQASMIDNGSILQSKSTTPDPIVIVNNDKKNDDSKKVVNSNSGFGLNSSANNSGFNSTTSSAFGTSGTTFGATPFGTSGTTGNNTFGASSSSSGFGSIGNGLNGSIVNSSAFTSTTSSPFGTSSPTFGATAFGASSSSGFGASNNVSGFDSSSKNFGVVAYNSANTPAATMEKAVAQLELEEDEDGEGEEETAGDKLKQVPSTPQSIKPSNNSKKKLRKEAIVKQETVKKKVHGSPKNQNRPASRPESISRREPTGYWGKGSSNFTVPVVKDGLIIRPLNRDWDTGGKVRKSASSPYRVDTKISPNLSLWSTITSEMNIDIKTKDNSSTVDDVTIQKGFDKSVSLKESPLRSLSLRPKSPGSPIMSSPSKKNFHSAKLLSQAAENAVSSIPVIKEDLISKKSVTSKMMKDTGKFPIYSKSPKLPKRNSKIVELKNKNNNEYNDENRTEKVDVIKPWESALAESSAKYDKTYHNIISSYSKRYKILSQKETGLSPAVINRLKKQRKEEDKVDQREKEVLILQDSKLSPKRPVTSKLQISQKSPRSQVTMISNSVSSDISTSSSVLNLKNVKKSDQLNVLTATPPDMKGDENLPEKKSSISQKMMEKNELSVVVNQNIEENIDFVNGRYDSSDAPNGDSDIVGKVLFPEILSPGNVTPISVNTIDTNKVTNDEKLNFDPELSSSIQKSLTIVSDNSMAIDESETNILHPATQIS